MAMNARGTRGYVCNNDSRSVSIVSVPGFEVTGTIETGSHPDGIAFVARRPAGRTGGN
jgi:YVTN family beta-propeller protein